jgi:hypothetical protein
MRFEHSLGFFVCPCGGELIGFVMRQEFGFDEQALFVLVVADTCL